MTVDGKFPRALHDLESEFANLATEIPDGPEKKAISVLHGIVMEVWRNLERDRSPLVEQGLTVNDIAELWKGGPARRDRPWPRVFRWVSRRPISSCPTPPGRRSA